MKILKKILLEVLLMMIDGRFHLRASKKTPLHVSRLSIRLLVCVRGFEANKTNLFIYHEPPDAWWNLQTEKNHECINIVSFYCVVAQFVARRTIKKSFNEIHVRKFKVSKPVNRPHERKSHSLHVLYLLETENRKYFWEAKKLHKS